MMRTRRYRSIDELSPAAQRGWGGLLIGIGALTAWSIRTHPAALRAPAWVAYCACAAFVIAGLAITLRAWVSRRAYAWLMVVLVAVMTAVPAWVALGDGVRQCRANVPFLRTETGCRLGFGVSALVMLGVCVAVVAAAVRTPSDPPRSGDG